MTVDTKYEVGLGLQSYLLNFTKMADGTAEERLLQKHRKERKELQAEIQSLKHSIPKGDKKKKKEVTAEVAKLESGLDRRQEQELKGLCQCHDGFEGEETNTKSSQADQLPGQIGDLSLEESSNTQPTRISKAQRRRDKKAVKEKERDERIAEDAANIEFSSRRIEEKKIQALLKERGLVVKDVSSDGHCLYNAVQHQLGVHGKEITMLGLREQVADYMRSHAGDFMCFLSKPESGDPYTPDDYDQYCTDIETTAAWGGQHEISAMTHIFKTPIQIVQAEGPSLIIGQHYQPRPLILIYHRHAYGLGEHYNSVTPSSAFTDKPEDSL